MISTDAPSATPRFVKIWDPFVRAAHWALAVAFLAAYIIEDNVLTLHVQLGYLAGAVVAARLAWGLIGSRHARFSDFLCPPRAVFGYLADLFFFRARRTLGHSPAGGAMAIALWLGVLATVGSGLVVYGADGKGPLAGTFIALNSPTPVASALADGHDGKKRKSPAARFWKKIHEAVAAITLGFVVVHVAGVLWASVAHHENLTRAMWDGKKRPNEEKPDSS